MSSPRKSFSRSIDSVGGVRVLRPTSLAEPRRPMARGALVRLQGRDGYRTSDKLPSLACHASASITGCVRKSLLRLRPSACLTRDHRLVAACRGSEAGEPTGAREQVCGPGVILTAGVKGAREISAGRSPLAKQVARAVRARQNHVGGVPANCGSGEQVGRRPRHRAAWRRKKPPHNST